MAALKSQQTFLNFTHAFFLFNIFLKKQYYKNPSDIFCSKTFHSFIHFILCKIKNNLFFIAYRNVCLFLHTVRLLN